MFLQLAISLIIAKSFVHCANKNAKEFRDMCALYVLLKQTVPEPTLATGGDGEGRRTAMQAIQAVFTDVMEINLTVAEDTVINILADDKTFPTVAEAKGTKGDKEYFHDIKEEQFKCMREANKRLSSNNKASEKFKTTYRLPISPQRKNKLRPVFYHLVTEALRTYDTVQQAYITIQQHRRQLRKAALTALFGKKFADSKTANSDLQAVADEPATGDDFPWGASAARDATCTTATADQDKAGGALATDMVCLCTSGSGSGEDLCATTGISKAGNVHTSGVNAKALQLWQEMTKLCDKLPEAQAPTISPGRLAAAATAITANFGTNYFVATGMPTGTTNKPESQRKILGAHVIANSNPPSCTGASLGAFGAAQKGVCIEYAGLVETSKGIVWLTQTSEASKQLNDIAQAFADAQRSISAAESIRNKMQTMLLTSTAPEETVKQMKEAGTGQDTLERQNKCKMLPIKQRKDARLSTATSTTKKRNANPNQDRKYSSRNNRRRNIRKKRSAQISLLNRNAKLQWVRSQQKEINSMDGLILLMLLERFPSRSAALPVSSSKRKPL
uniref:Variant surface glycoprotein 783 n=1 Tax=Trypanosoma brucei TaxID=5691 RepID=M4T2C2_9TRYP|nr:variant surface glycoprotein 783 [Trypanosoma brucei]